MMHDFDHRVFILVLRCCACNACENSPDINSQTRYQNEIKEFRENINNN